MADFFISAKFLPTIGMENKKTHSFVQKVGKKILLDLSVKLPPLTYETTLQTSRAVLHPVDCLDCNPYLNWQPNNLDIKLFCRSVNRHLPIFFLLLLEPKAST